MSEYKYTKDFVALLKSPLNKRLEFEIVITAESSLNRIRKLAQGKKYRLQEKSNRSFSASISDNNRRTCSGILLDRTFGFI